MLHSWLFAVCGHSRRQPGNSSTTLWSLHRMSVDSTWFKDNCSSSLLNSIPFCALHPVRFQLHNAAILTYSFSGSVCFRAGNVRSNFRFQSSTCPHHGPYSPGVSDMQSCSKTENSPRETVGPASATTGLCTIRIDGFLLPPALRIAPKRC